MPKWKNALLDPAAVSRINASLAAALAHCPTLDASGWSFRCVECHVAQGTYPQGERSNWHSHQEYQLEIPLDGRFLFEASGRKEVRLQPGQALVLPWRFAHRWTCLQSGPMLGVSLELLSSTRSIWHDGWLIPDARVVSSAKLRPRVDDFVRRAMGAETPAFHSKATACRLFLLLAEVLEYLLPAQGTAGPPSAELASEVRGREAVGWIIGHVQDHLAGDLTLQRVAQKVGLSTRHVHRLFLKHVGKSFHDHLLERRLEEARRLLREKGQGALIKEIAFECGFHSLAYFSNSFRKAFGVSPRAVLTKEATFKSGATLALHDAPEEAPGPSRSYRAPAPAPVPALKARASAAKRARG